MNRIENLYCKLAADLLEEGRYDLAVESFIKVYNTGSYKEEILQTLYDCFITPNDKEFRANYELQMNTGDVFFEDTVLDFLPVSSSRYWIFNKQKKEFLGRVDVTDQKKSEKVEFSSLLIADLGDVRDFQEKITERNWSKIYILLNKSKEYFYSFYKLPKFKEKYLQNTICFNTTEEMIDFFSEHVDCYLPKHIYAYDKNKYQSILNKVSKQRIESKEGSNNIFLSICMPSHNRGHVALKSVLQMLNMPYDSEIEIIISDNGSTKNKEGYEIIAKMQDTRIKYIKVNENKGYTENIFKVLENAKGKFAALMSDEDTIIIEKLGEYLNILKCHENAGCIVAAGFGENFRQRGNAIHHKGIQAIERGMDTYYLTGVTFNVEIVRKKELFKELRKLLKKDNVVADLYIHRALSMLIGQYGDFIDCDIYLWNNWAFIKDMEEKVVGVIKGVDNEGELGPYCLPESRVAQFNSEIEILNELVFARDNAFYKVFLNRANKNYGLMNLEWKYYPKTLSSLYSWEIVCDMIHQNAKRLLVKYNLPIELNDALNELYEIRLKNRPY